MKTGGIIGPYGSLYKADVFIKIHLFLGIVYCYEVLVYL